MQSLFSIQIAGEDELVVNCCFFFSLVLILDLIFQNNLTQPVSFGFLTETNDFTKRFAEARAPGPFPDDLATKAKILEVPCLYLPN